MSMNFKMNVYGITAMGGKIKIGHVDETIANAFPLGGKIFYIDPSDNGAIYHFYDKYGEEITDVRVGDQPYAYVVEGTPTKEKYYVFYPSAVTSKRWTYYKDEAYVYNLLGTGTEIGSGKANTNIVMAADDGAYVTNDSNGIATIWYELKRMRDNLYGGMSDWFVPSRYELEALRNATDRSGNALTTLFSNTYIWSSSESSAQHAWLWLYPSQAWDSYTKYNNLALLAVRAF